MKALLAAALCCMTGGGGNRAEWEKADPAMLNQKLKLLWLRCGTEDLAY